MPRYNDPICYKVSIIVGQSCMHPGTKITVHCIDIQCNGDDLMLIYYSNLNDYMTPKATVYPVALIHQIEYQDSNGIRYLFHPFSHKTEHWRVLLHDVL